MAEPDPPAHAGRWYEPASPAPATSVTPERPHRAAGLGRRRGIARRGPRVRRHRRRAQRHRCLPASGAAGIIAGRSDRFGAPAGHHRRGLGDHRRRRQGRPGRRQDHDQRQRQTEFGSIPETGVGSGVIYNPNGWILTNRHVVEGGNALSVELKDGRVLTGEVYGIDTLTDLAIVKIEGTDLPTANLGDSDALEVGQLVIAIGSPLGTYSNTVTSGIVSAKGRSIAAEGSTVPLNNLIQTDAAINPGNSGGPLLDAAGNVVGINTAIARDSTGIGFSIPINIAKPIMDQAVAGEELARPYLGVRYEPVTVRSPRRTTCRSSTARSFARARQPTDRSGPRSSRTARPTRVACRTATSS